MIWKLKLDLENFILELNYLLYVVVWNTVGSDTGIMKKKELPEKFLIRGCLVVTGLFLR